MSGRGRAERRALLTLGVALVSLAAASPSGALTLEEEVPTPTAKAELSPSILPRGGSAPASLSLGFTSELPASPEVPQLSRIEIDVSRNVTLQVKGLPSCTEGRLLSDYSRYGSECPGSLVGTGSVTSEVALYRDEEPVTISGRLNAYYSEENGRRLILAQVRSAHPPLTYVIPFTLRRARGRSRVALVVPKRRMLHMLGACQEGHPECFGTPYTLEGVYSHISEFEISLHRLFGYRGAQGSFVRARCGAPSGQRSPPFPLATFELEYATGVNLRAEISRRCRTAPTVRAFDFVPAIGGTKSITAISPVVLRSFTSFPCK